MRIISGKFKGKPVSFLKSKITRPLKDTVKENIFNVISHSNLIDINLNNANVLDIYSGVGSFGLECISRGSAKITFVEKDKDALEVLKKNITSISSLDNANIIAEDIFKFISKKITLKFDIIFLDPPFMDFKFHEIIKLIHSKKIYKKQHIIIIHRETNTKENFDDNLNTIVIKKYGRSKIIFGKFLL